MLMLLLLLNLKDKVVFLGELTNPYEAFLEMDVYLMCSRNEGLGRVTLEAMASNLPIIGYKNGGTIELIIENKNGIFYENDHFELAKQLEALILNKQLRLEMGDKGREMFEKRFTNEIYTKIIFDHIINCLKQ